MQVKVKLNYLRIAPRKVRQVVNVVRGKKAGEAEAMLGFLVNKPAKSVLKLLKSAIASAKHDFQLESDNLYISKIFVDEGPKLKRWQPVSRGSAHPLWKRVSHITLVLDEVKPTPKKKTKKAKVVEEVKVEEPAKEPEEKPAVQEKPRFEKIEQKKTKGPNVIKRIFRRKAF